MELLRRARKWKLHSKENYKDIKHFLAKQRFCLITSVKDGLKPLLFSSCESRRTASCTRKKRRLGSREMGAAGSSLAASRNASLVCFSNSVGMWMKIAKSSLEKKTAASPAPSHPRRAMGRTRPCLWKTWRIPERQLQKRPGLGRLGMEHPINQAACEQAELSAKQSWDLPRT